MMLLCGQAFAEPALYQIYNDVYNTSLTSDAQLLSLYGKACGGLGDPCAVDGDCTVGTCDPLDDEVLLEINGFVTASARYAGYTQVLGYYTGLCTGSGQTQLFNVTTTGYLGRCSAGSSNPGAECANDTDCPGGTCDPLYSAQFLVGGGASTIGFYNDTSGSPPWYSQVLLNSDGKDHMRMYRAAGFDPLDPEFFIGWEDYVGLGDADYQDLVMTTGLLAQATAECCDEDADCDDGDPCTVDTCVASVCQYTPKDCSSLDDQCIVGVCDPATGDCVPDLTAKNGQACDDDDPCTINDTCADGDCLGAAKDCSYLNDQCVVGYCDADTGNCLEDLIAKNGQACDDGDPCTINDVCAGGDCLGAAKDCSYLNDQCVVGYCDAGTGNCLEDLTAKNGQACDDGDYCTDDDICSNGECAGTQIPGCPCFIQIYEGGYPVPPLNTFSKPGRRGLALTCGDTVQFDYCTDCLDPCPTWSLTILSGAPPAGTSINPATGLLTIGPDCSGLAAPAELMITVTDPCSFSVSDSVIVTIGEVILSIEDTRAAPGSQGVQITLSMNNLQHAVKGIQTDIWDEDNRLVCTGCTPDPERAPEFICSSREQADGTCRVVLVSTNPAGLIEEGTGPVVTLEYDVAASAPADGCIDIAPTQSKVSSRFGESLCVCEEGGDVCFITCGDVYPRECLPDLPNCGDSIADVFDIMEEIDFVLDIVMPSACQMTRTDVPTGTPPYCSAPDGEINVLDVQVIIDMALGKANCCDYYYFGKIY
jgi:hypothetical protein